MLLLQGLAKALRSLLFTEPESQIKQKSVRPCFNFRHLYQIGHLTTNSEERQKSGPKKKWREAKSYLSNIERQAKSTIIVHLFFLPSTLLPFSLTFALLLPRQPVNTIPGHSVHKYIVIIPLSCFGCFEVTKGLLDGNVLTCDSLDHRLPRG